MKNWLSFIIPVYNGEKYITQAVESILNQAETGIEIVIVDDGSTDDSYLLCKGLADKYNSIKLIRSENKGVSHARNLGISKADAEWIFFLDADDYLLESAVSEMKKISTVKEDIVVFNYKRNSNKSGFNEEKKSITNNEAINVLLDFAGYRMLLPTGMGEKYSVFTSCWAKMYRKSVIDTNEIRFQESLTLSEDMCFNLMYFKKIQNVLIVNKEVYNYSDNPESVTHSFSEKKFLGRKELIVYLDGVHDIPKECEKAKQKDTLFLFCGKKNTRIKGLLWEGDGFLLLYKRLDVGAFSWPRNTAEALEITSEQYKLLMEGFAIVAKRPITELTNPPRAI